MAKSEAQAELDAFCDKIIKRTKREQHIYNVRIAAALARVTCIEHAPPGKMLANLRVWHGHQVRSDWGSWLAGVWTEGECGACGGCGQVVAKIRGRDQLRECMAPHCLRGRVGRHPPKIPPTLEELVEHYKSECKAQRIGVGQLPALHYRDDEVSWNVLSDGRVGIIVGRTTEPADRSIGRLHCHAEYHGPERMFISANGTLSSIRLATKLLEAVHTEATGIQQ